MWEDWEHSQVITGPHVSICAIKYAGVLWPGEIDYWVSLHVEKFQPFISKREEMGYPPAERIIVHREQLPREFGKWQFPEGNVTIQPEFRWTKNGSSGSSSLYAIKCLMKEGYEKIILCGCPMDSNAGHLEPDAKKRFGKSAEHFKKGWGQALPFIGENVRSMSGWTRELLGEPDRGWLHENSSDLLSKRS